MQNYRWWHPEGKPEPDEWDHETMTVMAPYRHTGDSFHIGQSYENEPAKVIACRTCDGRKFEVGRGSYFTAIKCCNCGWEYCVHDG